MKKIWRLFLIAFIIITAGCYKEKVISFQEDIYDFSLPGNKAIIISILDGDNVEYINQDDLLKNLSVYAKDRGSERVRVAPPSGSKTYTVEIKDLQQALDMGLQLVDDTERYIIAKREAEKSRIMNRLEIGNEIKHASQDHLLDNLDNFRKENERARVWVTAPDGQEGTIELRELGNAIKDGYQLIDDTEGYNNRPDIIAKREAEKSRIMNRVKVGDEIKHIDQQTLLDNLDAFARKRGSDRIYVTNPEGKRGTVELRELRDVLDAGYQLIDDTEGYNNRPDIIAKRNAETDNAFIQLDTVKKKSFNIEQYFDYIKESVINLKSLKMNNLLIPVLLLILIGLIIRLSNKNTPPKYLIINDNTWRLVKIILAVAALYIAYLFALNGRYTDKGDYIESRQLEYRDKWKIQMQDE